MLSLDFKAEYIQLSLSKSLVIKSPGYPNISYAKGITYRWHVNSFGITEKISIKIKMDLFEGPGSQCGDYLQVCVSELIGYMHFYAYVSEEIVKILLLIIFYQDI